MKLILASTSNFKSNVLKQACIKHTKKEINYIILLMKKDLFLI